MSKTIDSSRFPKDVHIKEASNGFVISQFGERKEKIEVAKDWKEAVKIAGALMGQKNV